MSEGGCTACFSANGVCVRACMCGLSVCAGLGWSAERVARMTGLLACCGSLVTHIDVCMHDRCVFLCLCVCQCWLAGWFYSLTHSLTPRSFSAPIVRPYAW